MYSRGVSRWACALAALAVLALVVLMHGAADSGAKPRQDAPAEKPQAKKPGPGRPGPPHPPSAGKGGKPAAPKHGKQKPAPAARGGGPQLDARSWVIVDALDDSLLAAGSPDKRLPIASTTKLMTAFVVLKQLRPSKRLVAPPYKAAAAESLLGLRAGEKLTVKDLLYALLLPSANDAAETLAVGAAGSEQAFVSEMNSKAVALGLENTSYANPIGLDDPDNFSSANDLVELAGKLRRNRLFRQIVDSPAAVLSSGAFPRRITSRNTLLSTDPSVSGVKTGHTDKAGYVLVASAERNGTTLISAVLGVQSEAARDSETERLLDYGFSQYRASTPVGKGEELAAPTLDFRDETLPLIAVDPIRVSARRGQSVETTIDAPDELSGTIEKGEKLGSAEVSVDGRVTARTALVASRAAEAASTFQKITDKVENPVILIPLGLIVIGVGLLLRRRRRPDRGASLREPKPPREPKTRRNRQVAAQSSRTAEGAEAAKAADATKERTPEERRAMHDERMRKRQVSEAGDGSDQG